MESNSKCHLKQVRINFPAYIHDPKHVSNQGHLKIREVEFNSKHLNKLALTILCTFPILGMYLTKSLRKMREIESNSRHLNKLTLTFTYTFTILSMYLTKGIYEKWLVESN
jgi:hypothetical protein